jgi:hypothetical protein
MAKLTAALVFRDELPDSPFHVSRLESKLYMVSCSGINLILIQTYGTVSYEDYWIITVIPEKIDG